MVTEEKILKILNQLNQKKANTSLAIIGCILKGDTNSICSDFSDFDEFGSMDEKSIKNLGEIFDQLIDKKLIHVVNYGLIKKYEVSKEGLLLLDDSSSEGKDKYYSSVGSSSDYLEEKESLKNTQMIIDEEIHKKDKKIDKSVKPSDTGIDYAESEYLTIVKRMNQTYEQQIKELTHIKNNPYFGRMDLIESKDNDINILRLYIGYKLLKIDDDDQEIILDWRSPIASKFYDSANKFEHQDGKYDVQLKRKIDIENSVIKYIFNQLTKQKATLKDTISDPFLINILKKKKDTQYFTDIIATIQEKQNEIIRLPLETNIIVQGCAGSGKTMILLHRLSQILYNYKKLNPEYIKIITPSNLFNVFVEGLSNELGLNQISRISMAEFYAEHINQIYPTKVSNNMKSENDLKDEIINILYSSDFLDRIVTKVKEQINEDIIAIETLVKNRLDKKHKQYLLLNAEIEKLINGKFNTRINKLKTYFDEEDSIVEYLSFEEIELFNQELVAKIENNIKIKELMDDIEKQLLIYKSKASYIDEILDEKLILHLIKQSNPNRFRLFDRNKFDTRDYLENYKNDLKQANNKAIESLNNHMKDLESSIIDLKKLELYKKTQKYVDTQLMPLFNEIHEKQSMLDADGKNYKELYENDLNSFFEGIQKLYQYTENYGENRKFIDEILKLLNVDNDYILDMNQYFESIVLNEVNQVFEKHEIKIRYHNQYKYYYYLKLALLSYFGHAFNHLALIMFDEAQEYALNEYSLIKNIHPLAYINYYGDIKQTTSTVGLYDWNPLKSGYKYYELHENYRNPKPIVQFINDKLHTKMASLGLDIGNVSTDEEAFDSRIDAILYIDTDKDTFIENNQIPTNKINTEKIISIDEAKGLEFNSVVVYTKGMSENQKYIAYSRALENLIIIDDRESVY